MEGTIGTEKPGLLLMLSGRNYYPPLVLNYHRTHGSAGLTLKTLTLLENVRKRYCPALCTMLFVAKGSLFISSSLLRDLNLLQCSVAIFY